MNNTTDLAMMISSEANDTSITLFIGFIIAAIGVGLANLSTIAWGAIYCCIYILYHYGGLIAILFGIVYVILKRFGIRPRRN